MTRRGDLSTFRYSCTILCLIDQRPIFTHLEQVLKRGPRKSPKIEVEIEFQRLESYSGTISSMHAYFERYR